MGAGEWLDREDTWAFIPAFVNPHDAGVLKVFESANKVLRTLGGPLDAFKGYLNRASPRDVRTQMQAIYQTLRDEPIALRYIAPPGSPVFDRTSRRRVGQVVRTHAEVIERRYGTCHDLALLLAACAEYIGIRPLIVLVSGHTFVGYWTSSTAHDTYWTEAGKKILDQTAFGPKWTFTDGQALMNLVDKQDVVLVEATYVCQPVKTFAQACKYRVAEFKENMKEDLFDVAIDVYAARQAVQPL
jgi:hypothetical protein